MKTCTKCKIPKDILLFNKNGKNIDGHSNWCKQCMSDFCKQRRLVKFVEIKAYQKLHYAANKKNIIDRIKKNSLNRIDEIKEYQKQYYAVNKDIIIERVKEWTKENPDKKNKAAKNRRIKNPHIFAWRRVLQNFVVRMKIKKTDRTHVMLGYSSSELKAHLELLFEPGMSWNNYGNGSGNWNIDHIKAVSKFDKSTPSTIVNALSNLQPMWALDNIKKGNK
jgi:hypothetical protein